MPYAQTAVALILNCLCVMPAWAQQDACHVRTIAASVFSKDGASVPPLSNVNFKATYKREPVRVRVAPLEQIPSRLIILLDTSGSMKETQSGTLDIAESVLSRMPPNAEVGLAFFAKDLIPVALPTSDREGLNFQLKGLRAHPSSYRGTTALWDALAKSVGMFSHPQLGDAVFLITDGVDTRSKTRPEEVIQLLEAAGIRLFVVQVAGLDLKNFGMTREHMALFQGEISQVAEATGGYAIKSISPDRVSVDKKYWQIVSFYRIEVDLPEAVDKPREWKLNLVGLAKPQRDNLILSYPQMLVPCR